MSQQYTYIGPYLEYTVKDHERGPGHDVYGHRLKRVKLLGSHIYIPNVTKVELTTGQTFTFRGEVCSGSSPIAVDLTCANEEIAYFYASFQREIFCLNDFYDIREGDTVRASETSYHFVRWGTVVSWR